VVCPLKGVEWDALNVESNPELWSVVSVVRLPPVGRNTEQQTIFSCGDLQVLSAGEPVEEFIPQG